MVKQPLLLKLQQINIPGASYNLIMNKYLSQMLHIPNELERSRHLSLSISSCSVSLSHVPPVPQISKWEQSAWGRIARARVGNGWKTESVFLQTKRASSVHLPQGS